MIGTYIVVGKNKMKKLVCRMHVGMVILLR